MAQRNFNALLQTQWDAHHFVSVGLDTNYDLIPPHLKTGNIGADLFTFNKTIVDATRDVACVYKPNSAYHEAYGAAGVEALKKTCDYILKTAPSVGIVLDAKRADIGVSNAAYAQYAFDYLQADAITVHPYLGREALEPFLNYSEKGIIILCHTSNPGAEEFQELEVNGEPLYTIVARHVAEKWNLNNNCSLVVGATYPNEINAVRSIVGDMPLLIPGVGAQGGDVEATVKAARDSGNQGFIINSSRGIIFASNGKDFAEAAYKEAVLLNEQIDRCRQQ